MTPSEPLIRSIRFLALGDSYTIGESVTEKERWPDQLAARFSLQGIQTEVTIIARTGWTTDELWQGIEENPPHGIYDLVSLLIGVNNQYRGLALNEYREEFRFLLNKSIEYADGNVRHVFVLSIPDWGVTPFAADRNREQITKDVEFFNSVNHEEAVSAGVNYVDITPISIQAAIDSSLVASDGLHPSGKMYKMWVEKALPTVIQIIN
jgi:lysophospholipase L1-like esterase